MRVLLFVFSTVSEIVVVAAACDGVAVCDEVLSTCDQAGDTASTISVAQIP